MSVLIRKVVVSPRAVWAWLGWVSAWEKLGILPADTPGMAGRSVSFIRRLLSWETLDREDPTPEASARFGLRWLVSFLFCPEPLAKEDGGPVENSQRASFLGWLFYLEPLGKEEEDPVENSRRASFWGWLFAFERLDRDATPRGDGVELKSEKA